MALNEWVAIVDLYLSALKSSSKIAKDFGVKEIVS